MEKPDEKGFGVGNKGGCGMKKIGGIFLVLIFAGLILTGLFILSGDISFQKADPPPPLNTENIKVVLDVSSVLTIEEGVIIHTKNGTYIVRGGFIVPESEGAE